MQINIRKIDEITSEGILIEFLCSYGVSKGLWKGPMPEINKDYYVEYDIPKILLWGRDINISDSKRYNIWVEEDKILLNVKIECIDDDNITIVRFGDSIILLETEGIPYEIETFVRVQINMIQLYPFEL